ncbi:GTPase [Polaribacter sp.]|uniref:GTPase n=1 Tax=Polaribacter sp. TaxID=1920175 RepID=UPI004047EC8D
MEIGKQTPNEILVKFKNDLENFKNATVKCGIIGRSGTGKSSLINAIAGEEVAVVGVIETTMDVKKPIIHNGIYFYDLPGCSTQNFKKENYINEFKIGDFDCVIMVTADRFYEDDLYLIEELIKIKVPVFAVRTKIDYSIERELRKGISEEDTLELVSKDLKEKLKGLNIMGIYLTSSDFPTRYDLSNLLRDISSKLNSFKREKFIAAVNITSNEMIKEKKKLAKTMVVRYAALSAANGLNPIPGTDVAVDLSLLFAMGKQIENLYGLDNNQWNYTNTLIKKETIIILTPKILNFAKKYITKEAIMILLKRAGVKVAAKSFIKWIPFVGQVIAAGIGFKMTSTIGNDMINDAEKLAIDILASIKNEAQDKLI